MNTNEDVKIPRLDQRLSSVSSESSFDSYSFYKRDTNDMASSTHENKQHVKNVGGETKINTFDLNFLGFSVKHGKTV